MAKGSSVDELSDFEDALDELTSITDNLDAACDAYDLADDEESRDEALELAGQALVDLAKAIQEVNELAQDVETTDQTVMSKWGNDLAHITKLPPKQDRVALDALLDETRNTQGVLYPPFAGERGCPERYPIGQVEACWNTAELEAVRLFLQTTVTTGLKPQ